MFPSRPQVSSPREHNSGSGPSGHSTQAPGFPPSPEEHLKQSCVLVSRDSPAHGPLPSGPEKGGTQRVDILVSLASGHDPPSLRKSCRKTLQDKTSGGTNPLLPPEASASTGCLQGSPQSLLSSSLPPRGPVTSGTWEPVPGSQTHPTPMSQHEPAASSFPRLPDPL